MRQVDVEEPPVALLHLCLEPGADLFSDALHARAVVFQLALHARRHQVDERVVALREWLRDFWRDDGLDDGAGREGGELGKRRHGLAVDGRIVASGELVDRLHLLQCLLVHLAQLGVGLSAELHRAANLFRGILEARHLGGTWWSTR